MLFCNRLIDTDSPEITDIAPTVLDLFGVPIPAYMDGRPIMTGRSSQTAPVSSLAPTDETAAQPA
jgi:arylsulfatase A-like enzyme